MSIGISGLITFDEASAKLKAMSRPLERITVPIADAAGLVLAAGIVAKLPSPRCDVSVMDGYAIRAIDLPGPFDVIGESAAGNSNRMTIGSNETVRIFTGAPLPGNANRVIVQEIVERTGDRATIVGEFGDDIFVRKTGSDFAAGMILLPEGAHLGPGRMVLAAAADRAEVSVWRRPKIAILATGNELAPSGSAKVRSGAIPESVSGGVAALARQWGGDVTEIRRVVDDAHRIEGEAAALLRICDILVVIGGASVGAHDFARHSVAGGECHEIFAKVAMQPGKPVWCAASGTGQFVLGLPGNPVSAMVTARLFLAPLLHACAGRDFDAALPWVRRPIASDTIVGRPREQFARGVRKGAEITLLGNQLSSSQLSLATADTLVRIPAGEEYYEAGTLLKTLPF